MDIQVNRSKKKQNFILKNLNQRGKVSQMKCTKKGENKPPKVFFFEPKPSLFEPINAQFECVLELLKKEWLAEKNINAFLYAKYIQTYRGFISKKIQNAPSKEKYYLKKSLYDRIICKIMSNKGKNTGKKIKIKNIIDSSLKILENEFLSPGSALLVLALVKAVPNYTIRSLKFGSGSLTRAVKLTVSKKISWFLKNLVKAINSNKGKKNLKDLIVKEFSLILNKSLESKIIKAKIQATTQAERANIQ